jgi:molybdate transport system substrate-binding protein
MLRVLLLVVALTGAQSPAAHGMEIHVLSANVFTGVLEEVAKSFERASGDDVKITYATAGMLRGRIQSGETADVIILPRPMLEALAKQGKVFLEGSVDVARSAVGLAVRAGMSKPEIGSIAAIKRALQEASSISYADPSHGGATGVLITQDFQHLGIDEEMRAKTRFPPEGHIAVELLERGEVALALAQPMEVLAQPGVELVGLLPDELQAPADFTFSAAMMSPVQRSEVARAFLAWLHGPEAAAMLRAKGMIPG